VEREELADELGSVLDPRLPQQALVCRADSGDGLEIVVYLAGNEPSKGGQGPSLRSWVVVGETWELCAHQARRSDLAAQLTMSVAPGLNTEVEEAMASLVMCQRAMPPFRGMSVHLVDQHHKLKGGETGTRGEGTSCEGILRAGGHASSLQGRLAAERGKRRTGDSPLEENVAAVDNEEDCGGGGMVELDDMAPCVAVARRVSGSSRPVPYGVAETDRPLRSREEANGGVLAGVRTRGVDGPTDRRRVVVSGTADRAGGTRRSPESSISIARSITVSCGAWA
jgi:hypothetical protein